MRLFIAEKELVAKAIALVLGTPDREAGYYRCGSDIVTWCSGHMLSLCDPEDYDERFKQWSLSDLPIVHIPWRYKVIPQKVKQLNVVKGLVAQASEIVHAGDTDAEGQLLIDEILDFFNVRLPVKRVLITDNNARVVKRALDNLRNNREFYGLYQSALARSVSDQLYGYNMTRLYTLKAKEQGYHGVLSVGRVQTPILGLVVNRDRAVEGFKSHPYFLLQGQFTIGSVFPAMLEIPEGAPVDDDGRIVDRSWIAGVQQACLNKSAIVLSSETREQVEHPPLPYDLLQLQAEASRHYGFDPDKTLAITQALRDKYNLITYNRSDCRYLSDEQHPDAPTVLATVANNVAGLPDAAWRKAIAGTDATIKSRAFNSKYVKVHHGIVPTEDRKNVLELTADERAIYLMIARQYIAQFWPLKRADVTTVKISCEGYTFTVSGTLVTQPGWTTLFDKSSEDASNDDDMEGEELQVTNVQILRTLKAGQQGMCTKTDILERKTQPPKHYTIATLLLDLRRVAKYASPEIATLLRQKDEGKKDEHGGIGTAATRSTFIATLLERKFIKKSRGKLISTPLGREFHDWLPVYATRPDMTALWHEQQTAIERGELTATDFIRNMVKSVSEHIVEIKAIGLPTLSSPTTVKPPKQLTDYSCGACGKNLIRRENPAKRATKTTKAKPAITWYGCSGYPECKQTYFDKQGKPDVGVKTPDASAQPTLARQYNESNVVDGNTRFVGTTRSGKTSVGAKISSYNAGDKCPDCNSGILCKKMIEKGKNSGSPFLGCNRFPGCRFFQWAKP